MATSEIAQCLSGTLSPDTNTRIAAELSLAELFTRPGMQNFDISTAEDHL